MQNIITRFAPSPTGPLHIGSVRTALFNYLFTKNKIKDASNAKFLLRIEDTDKERSKQQYEDSILNGLNWLQINWDDKIIRQSENIETHIKYANILIQNGGAFKCICKPEDLINKRNDYLAKGKNIKRLCNDCQNNEKIQSKKTDYCIRLKIDDNIKTTSINDKVQGNIKINNEEIDNYIILRTDGTPTYMLSVVIDDHIMGVTHIIRGDDHLNNAFRQYHLYKNLNWKIPEYIHIPLIHGIDGKKLSKRHGAVDINDFKQDGFLPEAIINYLLQIGISFDEKELFGLSEAIDKFKINIIKKSPSIFDYEKIKFLNSKHIDKIDNILLIKILNNNFNLKLDEKNNNIVDIIDILKLRIKTLRELKNEILIYVDDNYLDNGDYKIDKNQIKIINNFIENLTDLKDWSKEKIHIFIDEFIIKEKIKFKQLGIPLRLILTGKSDAPSIKDILFILKKENVINRINKYLNKL